MTKLPTNARVYPLHSHSTLSILDGASTIDEYLGYCKENDLCGCGITDHGYVLGLHDLLTKAPKFGVKPIPACEFYLTPRADHIFKDKPYDYFHLTVWARNLEGYRSLITLASHSWYPGRPVTKWGRKIPRLTFDDLAATNAGLIVGSGCIEGPIGKPFLKGEPHEATKNLHLLREIFKDRFFMELMPGTVDRDFHKEETIEVSDQQGTVFRFLPEDQVLTEYGWMSAEQAMSRRVSEIIDSNPKRAQDAPISVADQRTIISGILGEISNNQFPNPREINQGSHHASQ